MESSPKPIANTVKTDNRPRKVKEITQTFATAVKEIDDPRSVRDVDYPLGELLFVALVAIVCGASSYPEIEAFGKEQLRWLKKFFPFKNGTPSHDTL